MNQRDKRLLKSWQREGFIVRGRAKSPGDPQIFLKKKCRGGLTICRTWIPGYPWLRWLDLHVWDFAKLRTVVKKLRSAVDALMSLRKKLGKSWSVWVKADGLPETAETIAAALRTQDPAEQRGFDSVLKATKAERKVRDIERSYGSMIEAIRVYHEGRWCYDLHAAGDEKSKTASRENRRLIAEIAIVLNDSWSLRRPPIGSSKGSRTLSSKQIARARKLQEEGKGRPAIAKILFPSEDDVSPRVGQIRRALKDEQLGA